MPQLCYGSPDQLEQMIAWEEGALSHDDEICLFQSLVDSGLAWQLQGVYGRNAVALAREGAINIPKGAKDYWGNTIHFSQLHLDTVQPWRAALSINALPNEGLDEASYSAQQLAEAEALERAEQDFTNEGAPARGRE